MISRVKFAFSLLCKGLSGILIMGLINGASAGELGHYMPGVAGIRDFAVPSPGFYYAQYNLYYATDTYKDRNGNEISNLDIGPLTVDIDTNIESFAIVPTFIWVSDWKILGVHYGVYAAPAIVNVSVQAGLSTNTRFGKNIDESDWGLGDLYVRPVWLGWNNPHTAVSLGYGVYMPTGDYDDGDVDNTGLGFWTHEFQASMIVYPWVHQGTAIMLTGTYEIHHEKDGADITPGDRFSLDYGVSQFLPLDKNETILLELGVAGYSNWQVEEDSGSNVNEVLKVKDEVHAIGGQIGIASVKWNASLSFRYMKEYDAEARFEGDLMTLTFSKGF